MADNYLSFSAMISCKTKEEQKFVLSEFENIEKLSVDEVSLPNIEAQEDSHEVWIHCDEYADIKPVIDVVKLWQKKFKINDIWSMSWAQTCSKPRLDEFGGGAVAVYKGKEISIDAHSYVIDKMSKFIKKKGK